MDQESSSGPSSQISSAASETETGSGLRTTRSISESGESYNHFVVIINHDSEHKDDDDDNDDQDDDDIDDYKSDDNDCLFER